LYLQALAIREKALGPDHPATAFSLFCLGFLYNRKGEYSQAEPLLLRALAIQEKALKPDHPDLATSLNNLAFLYEAKGEVTKAEPMFLRALAINEKARGTHHWIFASSLNNMAAFYGNQGDYVRAEPLYLRSLAIREKVLGPDHLDVAQSLINLAGMYRAKGDIEQAITYQSRGNEVSERDLVRNLVSGSERQKLLYLSRTAGNTDSTLTLQVESAPQNLAALSAALTIVLRRKGRALDVMTSAIETLRRRQNPETQKLLDDYASLASQVSVLTLRGPGNRKPEDHLAYLRKLETQKEKLEAEISTRSAEFKTQVTPITLEAVRKLIPPDATLLEYAVYRPYDAKTRQFGNARYVVYLLDQSGEIRFADLGETEPIQKAVAAFRRAVSDQASTDAWSRKLSLLTQATGGNSTQANVKLAGHQLEKLIFEPVRTLIGTSKHLLISPDGDLNLIPFAALTDETGKYLAENYLMTYLTSGRDLLRLQAKTSSQEPPFILVNPAYGTGKGPVLFGNTYEPLSQLNGTTAEGTILKRLFPDATLRLDAQATKKTLQSVMGPSIAHIATHGSFLQNLPQEPSPISPEQRGLTLEDELRPVESEKLREANPLLRSCLFFAGANTGGTSTEDDGKLTALEAAQLNLWGTKLVVLSACDSGVGDIKNGDGVYGLRRALVLAGSESQVMSLWPVSDQGTKELMTNFYRRLKAGEGRSQALHNSQLDMLKSKRWKHPFYWAAFIQSGDWTNLDRK
ncbi:MAG TPA: CHAT domain-containing protein, partial [Acidobacteriota bacterium]|nr:CHAT domain-containing protein [Acidobacteriota bacterium]